MPDTDDRTETFPDPPAELWAIRYADGTIHGHGSAWHSVIADRTRAESYAKLTDGEAFLIGVSPVPTRPDGTNTPPINDIPRIKAQAEMIDALERGWKGELGIWPDWIYHARRCRDDLVEARAEIARLKMQVQTGRQSASLLRSMNARLNAELADAERRAGEVAG